MASDTKPLSRRARFAWGLVTIALGFYPIALGFGLLPTGEAGLSTPSWIVVAAGLVFVIAGFMILLARHPRANNLLAGILLLLFGVIGAWVSLFGSGDNMTGGLPFLPHELNARLGRVLFGLGSLLCFAMSVYAFRRATSR